ncbi:MAG: hypothetical protein CMG46_00410 [Candidatus Marinimicrobia bacterium]|nr:hypothetical protein [Candidatus Neomarinimicrobiota bacterium]
MRIGIITGKDDEISLHKEVNKLVPKKHYVNRNVHTDIALAYIMKHNFVGFTVDIITPKEITNQRLKKNDINFIIGYDVINVINDDPPVKKFSGQKGLEKLDKIYRLKSNNVFPSYPFLSFLWNKKDYLQHLQKHKIPISPTIFIKKNITINNLLKKIREKKWKNFIIKPIGGTIAYGLGIFNTQECINNYDKLRDYFEEENQFYDEYLVQEKIEGFSEYGEIKTFWIDGKLSYAVNTPGATKPGETYQVKEVIQKDILNQCEKIGNKIMEVLPKITFNKKKSLPVLIRIDFACCKGNKKMNPKNYFVNEIESDIAGLYINFPNVKYPALEILADTYVQKAYELVK